MGEVITSRGEPSAVGLRRLIPQRYRRWRASLYRHNLAVADSKNMLRTTGHFVALSCLLLSGGAVLLMFTPGGPDTAPGRIATSVVAAAAAVAAALWWFRGWPRERTSYMFVIAAEIGHGVVLFSCADPVVSLLAATWFFLIGDYLTFAHGRGPLLLHCAWVKVNLLFYGVRAIWMDGADIPFVVFLVVALTAVLIVTRLFGQVFADALRSDSERSAELAHRDPMTKLLNRRGLDALAPRMFGQARAEDAVIAVFLIDVDRFKAVNDAHGHLVGDTVLKLLAERLDNSVRKFGLVARTGGEEFVVLDRVHPDGIHPMAERLRAVCSNRSDDVPITVSVGAVGLASSDFPSNDPHVLLSNMIIRADAAMYAAKQRGGNQVVLELPRSPTASPSTDAGQLPPHATADQIFDNVIAQREQLGQHPEAHRGREESSS